jgi:hypothetical protein
MLVGAGLPKSAVRGFCFSLAVTCGLLPIAFFVFRSLPCPPRGPRRALRVAGWLARRAVGAKSKGVLCG